MVLNGVDSASLDPVNVVWEVACIEKGGLLVDGSLGSEGKHALVFLMGQVREFVVAQNDGRVGKFVFFLDLEVSLGPVSQASGELLKISVVFTMRLSPEEELSFEVHFFLKSGGTSYASSSEYGDSSHYHYLIVLLLFITNITQTAQLISLVIPLFNTTKN